MREINVSVCFTPARAFALAVPQGPGPPLHVERSSSGHWLWVGVSELGIQKQMIRNVQ